MYLDNFTTEIEVFTKYTHKFNFDNVGIKGKYNHSFKVMDLCNTIATKLSLQDRYIYIATLSGLYHDIGRFSQLTDYETFDDNISNKPHALIGADILEQEIKDKLYEKMMPYDWELFVNSVKYHTVMILPNCLSDIQLSLCNVLRDADKLDILRILSNNLENNGKGMMFSGKQYEDLINSESSSQLLRNIYQRKPISEDGRRYLFDELMTYMSFVYQLNYEPSRKMLKESGYLNNVLNLKFANPYTQDIWIETRNIIEGELNESNL